MAVTTRPGASAPGTPDAPWVRTSLYIPRTPRPDALRLLHGWRPAVFSHCRDLDLPPYTSPREFRFETDGCVLVDLAYARQRTDRVTGVSGGGAGHDPVVVQYVLAGRLRFESRTTAVTVGPGQLAIRDTAVPWRFWSAHATVSRWATVPRAVILDHLRGERALPRVHLADDGSPDVRFLVSYLELLRTGDATSLSPTGRRAARDATASLLAGLLSPRRHGGHPRDAHATAELAQRFIDAHLRDRDLRPAALATALGVSVRTLHRSFSLQSDSVMAYLRRRRLHEARQELVAAGRNAKVADVAARWRFADSSHFTRQFRDAYGVTPVAFVRSL